MTVIRRSTVIAMPERIGSPSAVIVTGGERYQFLPVLPSCRRSADRLEVVA